MLLSDKIKELIAEGKTAQAFDLLQAFLKGRDSALLNQCFLLENQFNELSRKQQQGLLESPSELNRVSLALLNLGDEAQKLDPEASFSPKKRPNTEGGKTDNFVKTAGIILGVILLITVFLFYPIIKKAFDSDGNKENQPIKTEQPSSIPSTTPQSGNISTENIENPNSNNNSTDDFGTPSEIATQTSNWRFEPSRLMTILDGNNYGRQRLNVLGIVEKRLDLDKKQVRVFLSAVCESTTTGTCISSFLNFRFKTATGTVIKPIKEPATLENTDVNTIQKFAVDFIVPTDFKGGVFSAFYQDQPKNSTAIKIFKKN